MRMSCGIVHTAGEENCAAGYDKRAKVERPIVKRIISTKGSHGIWLLQTPLTGFDSDMGVGKRDGIAIAAARNIILQLVPIQQSGTVASLTTISVTRVTIL